MAGMRWRVGDGKSIQVLGCPWLPDDQNPYVTTESLSLEGKKVCQLLRMDSNKWDEDVVKDVFEERDSRIILNFPLSEVAQPDGMYWSKEISGIYSVKSAYKMLQFLKGRWGSEMNTGFWRRLWQLKIQPKVKDLLWRACVECLPTMVQLSLKQVPVLRECLGCRAGEESILHCLVKCQFAASCLQLVSTATQGIQAESFADWFDKVAKRVDKEKLGEIAVVCWGIWRARNDRVWKNLNPRVNEVVSTCLAYLKQWKIAQNREKLLPLPSDLEKDGAVSWVKPAENQLKINVDAALFDERGQFGVGMIARDYRGMIVEARTWLQNVSVNSVLAEIMGIREALSWIKQKNWRNVVLETDCLVAVNAIRSSLDMQSPFGLVASECRKFLNDMSDISFLFVYRSANKLAHSLARASCSYPECSFSGRNVPPVFMPIFIGCVPNFE